MPTIKNDSKTHIKVLGTNMLSFIKYQVNSGKVKYDMPKIKRRGPHSSCISPTTNLTPNQKQKLAGTAKRKIAGIGLSFHQSQTN